MEEMANYAQLPHRSSVETKPFVVKTSDADLQGLLDLVRLSKLGPRTYENTAAGGKYGLTYDWMSQAKDRWTSGFDWRSVEARINALPNFISTIIDDDGSSHAVHFVGLFSKKKDAVPLMLIHGWPGSFLEFLGVLDALQSKYTPDELPYHVIVPSLPGYAYSEPPPTDRDWKLQDSARLLNKLMLGLGLDGYLVQGGDIGSYTSRIIGTYDACKAMLLNFSVMRCPDENLPVEDYELEALKRGDEFAKYGTAYSVEHATRPSTIGFTLASSPLALLSWIGEKFLTWSHKPPEMDEILASVTLYWLTESFPTSIYSYREELFSLPEITHAEGFHKRLLLDGPERYMTHEDPAYYCHKPLGYAWFPSEIVPAPKSWVAATGNLVWSRHHERGGHFAAMEEPKLLLADIEDFVKQVWS